MDRNTRRMRRLRVRSRRTKLIAGAAVATASMVVLAAAAFGQQSGGTPAKPHPTTDQINLTADPAAPVDAGWEGQVSTDANLVGVEWSGDPGAEFTVEVRDGGGNWRKGADVGANDALPDPGSPDAAAAAAHTDKNVSEPIWVGKDVSGVRVRLDDGTVQDVKLHVIDSFRGKKPEANLESTGTPPAPSSAPTPSAGGAATTTTTQPAQQGFGLGEGLAAAAIATLAVAFIVRRRRTLAVLIAAVVLVGTACAPAKKGPNGGGLIPDAIVSRSGWGGDLPWACPGGPEYAHVGTAIVHHTVNGNFYGPGDTVGMIRGIWGYHVLSLGYCDIAYNFIIDNYGTPFEGRMGGIDQPVIGAHSLNFNRGTTGIALLGTFSFVTPSPGALGTLENLIRWKLQIHGANPFDDPAADILGHRDTLQTECPGEALYNYLPYTRHFVKASW
jgi:N-acetylmuramoyl-L-alanine amidase